MNVFSHLVFLGKTTLIRILAGNLEPDEGGLSKRFSSNRHAIDF